MSDDDTLKTKVKSLPNNPGVYIFKDKYDSIIYIGKAKSLKKRVSSYFILDHKNSPKTKFLVSNIKNIDYIVLDNEVEALLLENKLIKKHKPKFNIDLKDDKTFAYIKITDEKIPKISSTRKVTKSGTYFGPYTNGALRVETIRLVIQIFKLITKKTYSSKSVMNYQIGISPAPRLEDIDVDEYMKQVEKAKEFLKGNTKEVLKKLSNEMKEASKNLKFEIALERKKQIEAIKSFEEKQKVDLIKDFDQDVLGFVFDKESNESLIEMFKISRGVITSKKEFKFAYYDDNLFEDFIKLYYSQNSVPKEIILSENVWEDDEGKKVIENYIAKFRGTKVILTVPQRGEKLSLVKLALKNANLNFGSKNVLVELQKVLGLPKLPKVIECFDISNLGYDYVVGGMTRWDNGKPQKEGYRKFEIKSFKGKQDDYRALKEVLYRRYKGLRDVRVDMGEEGREKKSEKLSAPDLIIIDGGKGQLRAAIESLKEVNMKIPIVSLAKRDEEIFILGKKDSIKLDKNSKVMLYVRKIRDSVHKFVITYNRKKREMRFKDQTKNL